MWAVAYFGAAFSVEYTSPIYTIHHFALNCVGAKEAERPKLLTGVQRRVCRQGWAVCLAARVAASHLGPLVRFAPPGGLKWTQGVRKMVSIGNYLRPLHVVRRRQ